MLGERESDPHLAKELDANNGGLGSLTTRVVSVALGEQKESPRLSKEGQGGSDNVRTMKEKAERAKDVIVSLVIVVVVAVAALFCIIFVSLNFFAIKVSKSNWNTKQCASERVDHKMNSNCSNNIIIIISKQQ